MVQLKYPVTTKKFRGGCGMLNKMMQPIMFQGSLKQDSYFEGWYYKQVSADERHVISFIPGISLIANDRHSFVQYIWLEKSAAGLDVTRTGYIRYPLEKFQYQNQPFNIKIAENQFSAKRLLVNLSDENAEIQGELALDNLHPIEKSILQPNIMGVFSYIPKMECYHGVISMTHKVAGYLTINDREIDFSGGKGYIEKDWGTSFPRNYIWLQSNYFSNPTASLFFLAAHIPFHFTEFEGFICNFIIDNHEYRFATYNGSRCKVKLAGEGNITIMLKNRQAELSIEASIVQQGKLIAPIKGMMSKTIKEGVSGIVRLTLHDKKNDKIYQDTGYHAGIEIVGY